MMVVSMVRAVIKVGLIPSTTGKKGGAITGRVSEYLIPDVPFSLAFEEYLSTGHKFLWSVQQNDPEITGE
jgi:hypothetical protein